MSTGPRHGKLSGACAYGPGEAGAPFSPPTAVLLVLAHLVKDRDVVDLRPALSSSSCLASTARSLTSLVHMNQSRCDELATYVSEHSAFSQQHGEEQQERKTRRLFEHQTVQQSANYSVRCMHDYHAHGFPDADYYVWWQMLRFWDNGAIKRLLSGASDRGAIRRGASALLMYDMTQWRDAIDWQSTGSSATWHKEVPFDNVEHCLETAPEKHAAVCRQRGNGTWIVASFNVGGGVA